MERSGYTVLVAQSGEDALHLMQRISPDIVLMDAVMPGLDGFETTRRMKTNSATSAIPVVFMTGLTETEDVVRGLEAGGVDFVSKPVALDEVVARVTVHVATARLSRSARAALDTTGRFLLSVTRDGALLWSTPQAARLLEQDGVASPLLDVLRSWLASSAPTLAVGAETTLPARTTPCRIRVAVLGEVSSNEILLRLTPEVNPEHVLESLLGLTRREAEVLLWLSRGKSNRDIATILDLSPRTVNKHLEQIFPKLEVENRASAAALVARLLATAS